MHPACGEDCTLARIRDIYYISLDVVWDGGRVKCARYFDEQVRRKRPYIEPKSCLAVIARPLRREVQENGRIRFWGAATDSRDGKQRTLRVVTLEDGVTIHNAFFDRDFREDKP